MSARMNDRRTARLRPVALQLQARVRGLQNVDAVDEWLRVSLHPDDIRALAIVLASMLVADLSEEEWLVAERFSVGR